MDFKALEKLEELFDEYKYNFERKVRIFFEDSFRMLRNDNLPEDKREGLISEFTNKPFKFGILNYVSLLQALKHLMKKEKSHIFDSKNKCKICGLEMNEQYKYKRFSTWHFDDGERVHRVK